MTDKNKEIYIDGVDVSGCENALQGKHTILCAGSEDRALCDANKNCLYKKYKRKEQECERLKKQLERKEKSHQKLLSKSNKYIHNLVDENIQDISNLGRQLDQLKAENETLFKAIEEVNKINKRLELENEELKKCYKNNSSLLDFEETNTTKLVNKVMKLEQTLTEIKEIAEKEVNTRMLFADKESFCDFNKILQKISECEVENER